MYIAGIFDKRITWSYLDHALDKKILVKADKARRDLEIDFIQPEKTLVDMANSFIEFGVIPKK
jgi:hypothetical protein